MWSYKECFIIPELYVRILLTYTISINERGYDLFQFTLLCFHINVDVNIQMLDGA